MPSPATSSESVHHFSSRFGLSTMSALFCRKTTALSLSVKSETDSRGSARFGMTCARMSPIPLIGSDTDPLYDEVMSELSAVRSLRELGFSSTISVRGVARVFEHAESRFHLVLFTWKAIEVEADLAIESE